MIKPQESTQVDANYKKNKNEWMHALSFMKDKQMNDLRAAFNEALRGSNRQGKTRGDPSTLQTPQAGQAQVQGNKSSS